MSWRLATFALLALVLVAGFGWYERSRPPARVVALVAALAALAIAGRLAFVAIPNVQATTDVVLIAGFAVGAGPGFAVGALGALVSNLWLGQGPWTPWEMAGWGLVGVGGAALGVVTRRRIGRLGLALACGLAGLAYGALLDYSVMATTGGEQSLDRYLAIAARGVPFNLAHAGGNFVLALIAGPALVRIVSRYRTRLEFTWSREWAAPLLAFALLAGAAGAAAPPARASGAPPAAWLARAENGDGGFGIAPGSSSTPEMTGWAMLGLEAANRNPLDLGGRRSAVDYLRANVAGLRSTGDLERTILALDGAGVSSRHFGGRDLLATLRARRAKRGGFGGEVNLTAFAILALRSTGEPAPSLHRSRGWLRRAENSDGGWGFQPGIASDADSTGAALQGLAAAGAGRRALRDGVSYLRSSQNRDGGWPVGGHGPSNSQSTAWAIQGLIAAGVAPGALDRGGRSGLDYIAARRAGDGHYSYSASSDQTPVWVTGQTLMAADREALPLAAVPREPHHQHVSKGGRGAPASSSSATAGPAPSQPSTSTAEAASADGSASGQGGGNHARHEATDRAGSGRAAGSRPSSTASLRRDLTAAAAARGAGARPTAQASEGSAVAVYIAIAAGVVLVAAAAWWWRHRRRLGVRAAYDRHESPNDAESPTR